MTETKRQRIKYIVSDLAAGNLAWCIFNIIRYNTLPYNYELMSLGNFYLMPTILIGQIAFPFLMVALYAVSGYYNYCIKKSRVDEILNTYGIALLGTIIIFFVALFNDVIDDRLKNYEMILILWALIGTITYIPRLILTKRLNDKILKREITLNTLIVGTNDKAIQLAYEFETRYANMGFNVVGYVSDNAKAPKTIKGKPVYELDNIAESLTDLDLHGFIIVHESEKPQHTVEVINKLFPSEKAIYITPDTMYYITLRPRTQMVSGEVLIDVTRSQIPASTRNIKRIADIVLSSLTLILISPLLAILAIIVKRSSPGEIIYKQERIGYHKKPFNIYKFRTMYVDSEKNGPALATTDDIRITPAGKILRKYRLDELPQFFNVLKGDMSIVGPRPEREHYLKQIIEKAPYFNLLQQVRPGITSWGMVKFGYASSVDEMIERANYDLLYIDNMSMIVDLKILLYTIRTVITGKGV